ncbi:MULTISPECIES: histidine phosphatase family protein [unclassified Pseudomonas]|uniref:histidine phosphatase family protein n=1 Tax=unclassified Pseudomonas TaxID=196821 RepID=UPI000A1DDE9B|nr:MULTISPECIES: histidine phosphatase family protein [unclassified Pseudomonas]
MLAIRLTLVCHARTVAQKLARFPTDEPIEQRTLADAALAARLDAPYRLVCGPELRTRQTAEAFGREAQVDEALRDCDWGRWQGQSIKALQQNEPEALHAWLEDPGAAPHGGESVTQLGERVAAWLAALQSRPGHTVAITHPFVIRAALAHVVQIQASQCIDVEPLALVDLRFAGRWRLRLPGIDLGGAL